MRRIERAGTPLAYALDPGRAPTIVFLPGLRSDMRGAKALALRAAAAAWGVAMLRLDYAGHGASGGRFEDGCIGEWAADAFAVIEATAPGPLILVGSSMGGWIGLLLARRLGRRIAGFVGIAAAPDFTETMIRPALTAAQRQALERDGRFEVPNAYGEPLPITRRLIEDGARNRVLGTPIPLTCPVRLLQGQQDSDVPWQTALALAEGIESADVQVELIKDGDHRLSREADLRRLTAAVASVLPLP
jgi:pimeloyl-ACP methyl ester carboxylesterase